MKQINQFTRQGFRFHLLLAFLLWLFAVPVWAADSAPSWRPVYDTVMMYINFGIFTFFLVKYAKRPIKLFLEGQRAEIAKELSEAQSRKDEILAKIETAEKELQAFSERLHQMKERIIAEGKRQRDRIIEDANKQAKRMIEMEQRKAQSMMVAARQAILAELVDMATDMAQQRLKNEITPFDQSLLLDSYLEDIKKVAAG